MLNRHIALVSETPRVDAAELSAVAAALQKQVIRDFAPIWGVQANVAAFTTLEHMPLDYWPIIICDNLPRPEAAGYHEDDLGEPYALVLLTDDWTVTASHEMLEILADPWGRHMVAGPSPRSDQTRVKFLVEVCDPCAIAAYEVNGVCVADFYTPRFFDPVEAPSVRYSFTGALTSPRQVLEGGYLTWYDPGTRKWWHRAWFTGDNYADSEVAVPGLVRGNIRSTIDKHVTKHNGRGKRPPSQHTHRPHQETPSAAFINRARDLRRKIDATD